jgi:hypothetical protein
MPVECQRIVEALKMRVGEFINGHDTCAVESMHRQRLAHATKDINYYKSFEGRCWQMACWRSLASTSPRAVA